MTLRSVRNTTETMETATNTKTEVKEVTEIESLTVIATDTETTPVTETMGILILMKDTLIHAKDITTVTETKETGKEVTDITGTEMTKTGGIGTEMKERTGTITIETEAITERIGIGTNTKETEAITIETAIEIAETTLVDTETGITSGEAAGVEVASIEEETIEARSDEDLALAVPTVDSEENRLRPIRICRIFINTRSSVRSEKVSLATSSSPEIRIT